MDFENKIYKINLIPKKFPDENYFHDYLQGKKCLIHFLKIGLPLSGLYEYKEGILHTFYTSCVVNFSEKEDGNIFVETENTYYKFEKLEN